MIYLAGPLFTTAEREFNLKLSDALGKYLNKKIFLPQLECSGCDSSNEIFTICKNGIDNSTFLIAVLDGPDCDSGTSFEIGYAYAKGIPVIGIRTDFRQCGEDEGMNLMLTRSCDNIIFISSLDNENAIEKLVEALKSEVDKYNN